jgi:signal transduction histidine kinase
MSPNMQFAFYRQFTATGYVSRMFRVLGCLVGQHDLRLIALAGMLCLFACVTAMSMLTRAREAKKRLRPLWLSAAGTVAGCGIWGTHFVAMLAYEIGFPVSYDPALTFLSVVVAAALCSAGFAIALKPKGAWIGGAVTGVAIGAMHYIGMAAVRVPADAIWDPGYVGSSILIGVGLAAVGMKLALGSTRWRSYVVGGLTLTAAIYSLHFTAMTAVVYRFDPRVAVSDAVIAPEAVAVAVIAGAILIVALGLVGAVVDHHLADRASREAERLRAYVSELERTRDALQRTSQELGAADAANTNKVQFLAAMSHELRTPLNAVIGFSDLLKLETFGPLGDRRYQEYARDIHSSGTHLLSLINDVLDIARLDSGQLNLTEETIDIVALASGTLRLMAPQAETAGVVLTNELRGNLPRVFADARRVRQVLLNLISNAVKFTPPGGNVTVSGELGDSGLALSIADTGIGIAEADIPRALERFGQVDSTLARRYQGAGLGLPLARDLIELHGGKLTLQSKPMVGTTVTITLPAHRFVAADSIAAA